MQENFERKSWSKIPFNFTWLLCRRSLFFNVFSRNLELEASLVAGSLKEQMQRQKNKRDGKPKDIGHFLIKKHHYLKILTGVNTQENVMLVGKKHAVMSQV